MSITKEIADNNFEKYGGSEDLIPEGVYCYRIKQVVSQDGGPQDGGPPVIRTETCPYWGSIKTDDEGFAGYCALLKKSDLDEDGGWLLFDLVKECGINDSINSCLDEEVQ